VELYADGSIIRLLRCWTAAAGMIFCAVIGAAAGFFYIRLLYAVPPAAGAVLFFWWVYPPRYAAALHGAADSARLRAVTGVWTRREAAVPMTALRTFECWTLPFQRLCGVRTMVLRVAGGAAVRLLLPKNIAEELFDFLSEQSE